jgi:hypothetical protein
MPPGPVGQTRRRHVTGEAAGEIRRGEEEHLLDLEWARHLAYETVADTINGIAAGTPASGGSPDAARDAASRQVCAALPNQLRWQAGRDPVQHWRSVYGQLVAVTRERDEVSHWHDMPSAPVLDPAEKRKLGLPEHDELWRYVPGRTDVGKHPSEPLVRARFGALAGTETPGPQGTPGPAAPSVGTGSAAESPNRREPPRPEI